MDIVEEIKARLDIVDVVGEYVPLQKAGRYYRALCPFHSERTPSFYVSPERQSWHCFGACGTGGDIFAFVMRKEGLEFRDALRLLAQRAGVSLPERGERREDDRLQRLRAATEAAVQFYHRQLLDSPEAAAARRYLEGRGVDGEACRRFLLGYSPQSRGALCRHLRALGFRDDELLEAGLALESEGGLRDRFHGRIMFPIWDERGRAVGFGARALDDSHPKYLNTPQTPIFDKGGLLYLLDRAREEIRRSGFAVIVEGYTDAIAAHQNGFTNVVASMGTSLTERQVQLLKRYGSRIVLALDADAAGAAAAARGHEVVTAATAGEGEPVPVLTWRGLVTYRQRAAVDLRVALLPQGQDPDQVIRSSPQRWRELVEAAEPVLEFRFRRAAESRDLRDPRARSELVQELLPLVDALADPVERAHYLQWLARLALVREEDLASLLRRRRRAPASEREESPPAPLQPARDQREDWLLALLLRYPSLRADIGEVREELFWDSANRQVLRAWQGCRDLAELHQSLPDELHGHVESLISLWTRFDPSWDNDYGKRAFESLLKRLEERQLRAEKMARAAALAAQDEAAADRLSLLEEALRSWHEKGKGETGPAALLVDDLELGLRLHRRKDRTPGAQTTG
jgi:DNA primase